MPPLLLLLLQLALQLALQLHRPHRRHCRPKWLTAA